MSLYSKIISTPRVLISPQTLRQEADTTVVKKEIHKKVKRLFGGSLAIREVDAGSTNAEEQELTALANAYYDCDRFGIHFVASPRHADMLIVTGAVSRNMAVALRKTYEAMPTPNIVVAAGNDAIDGGIFKGSYAVLDGVHTVIPVNFQIPGDPPSPSTILSSLLKILEIIDEKKK
ncbi:MAG TPA: NADH-quinone oxidoreductase subunit NuoB [Candidatus Saccharimonadales bacterium]|nr:NADH-quinone oxidoreductase subunit NuoB [Candidatus Saccharimonadales bacterium]